MGCRGTGRPSRVPRCRGEPAPGHRRRRLPAALTVAGVRDGTAQGGPGAGDGGGPALMRKLAAEAIDVGALGCRHRGSPSQDRQRRTDSDIWGCVRGDFGDRRRGGRRRRWTAAVHPRHRGRRLARECSRGVRGRHRRRGPGDLHAHDRQFREADLAGRGEIDGGVQLSAW